MKPSGHLIANHTHTLYLIILILFVLCSFTYSAPVESGMTEAKTLQPQEPTQVSGEAGTLTTAQGPDCVQQLPRELQRFFKDCTLVEGLDPGKARDVLESGRPITIPVGGRDFSIAGKLDESLFTSDASKGLELQRGDPLRAKASSNTFVGSLQGLPRSDAGVTISEDNRFIYGFGCTSPKPEDQIFFETLVEPQRREMFRVLTYRGSDVLLRFSFGDDTPKPTTAPNSVHSTLDPQTHAFQRVLGHGDGAYLASMGGSLSGAFAQMEFVLTCVRLWYQQFTNVRFQIAELWMRFSNFGPTEAAALRDAFTTHMEGPAHQPAATYHVAHLFTGINTDGTTIGISTFPGAGVLGHYAISQMVVDPGFYDATVFGKGILVAHETGHNYNATHGSCNPGPPADIMCAGGLGGPETRIVSFSAASVGLINGQEMVKTTR